MLLTPLVVAVDFEDLVVVLIGFLVEPFLAVDFSEDAVGKADLR